MGLGNYELAICMTPALTITQNGSFGRLQCLFSSLKLHMRIFQAAARSALSPTDHSFLLCATAEAPTEM